MKFEDAVKKSIKAFMRGKAPSATTAINKDGLFYSPEYFDELEETLMEKAPQKAKKSTGSL